MVLCDRVGWRGVLAILCVAVVGCPGFGEEEADSPAQAELDVLEELAPQLALNTLKLRSGYFGADGHFAETDATLYTCEMSEGGSGQFALQVSATISGPRLFDPDLTKVIYSSDGREWVSSGDGLVGIHRSPEGCAEAGMQCDEVVIGEGEVGFFEGAEGFLSVQNIWCRHWDGGESPEGLDGAEYSYTVSAYAVDINTWPETTLSHTGTIEIKCVARPCCPDADYVVAHGNHTVVPWVCPAVE